MTTQESKVITIRYGDECIEVEKSLLQKIPYFNARFSEPWNKSQNVNVILFLAKTANNKQN